MKKLVIISILLTLLVSACDRNHPQAQFSVNYNQVQPGEEIIFTNLSHNGVSYYWDFGDGHTSTAEHPTHVYDTEDEFLVTLTVTSSDGDHDVITRLVNVWYTTLYITAAEWLPSEDLGSAYIIPNALIVLYETADDWDLDQNPIAYGYTDSYGELEFPYYAEEQYYLLEPRRYWVYVEATDAVVKGDRYDNIDFWDYSPEEYLRTYPLTAFAVNEWTAWADYFEPEKSASSRLEKYPRKKIKDDQKALIKRRI